MPSPRLRLGVHKVVYELRYKYGFTYLDRCGSLLNRFFRKYPGWELVDDVNPQRGILKRETDGLQFALGSKKLDLGHEQADGRPDLLAADEFARKAREFTALVAEHLELEEFSRIGYRVWRTFATSSVEEAEKEVMSLGVLRLDRLQPLNVGDVDSVNWRVIADNEGTKTRIAVTAVERKAGVDETIKKAAGISPHALPRGQREAMRRKAEAKKVMKDFPQCAVLVDMDHYIADPPNLGQLDVAEFILGNHQWGEEVALKLMSLEG